MTYSDTSLKKTVHCMSDTEEDETITNMKSTLDSEMETNSRPSKENSKYSVIHTNTSIKNYAEHKNQLISINYSTDLKLSELDSENEYFIFQCPKLVDPLALINKKINLKSDFQKLDENLEVDIVNKNTRMNILASKNSDKLKIGIKHLQVSGTILVRKCIEEHQGIKLLNVKNEVQFPENLKTRHPIFGSNYKTNLKLDNSITEKLNVAEENKQKAFKKYLKSKSKNKLRSKLNSMHNLNITSNMFNENDQFDLNHISKCDIENEEEHKMKKKHAKRKKMSVSRDDDELKGNSESFIEIKKSKKYKNRESDILQNQVEEISEVNEKIITTESNNNLSDSNNDERPRKLKKIKMS